VPTAERLRTLARPNLNVTLRGEARSARRPAGFD